MPEKKAAMHKMPDGSMMRGVSHKTYMNRMMRIKGRKKPVKRPRPRDY